MAFVNVSCSSFLGTRAPFRTTCPVSSSTPTVHTGTRMTVTTPAPPSKKSSDDDDLGKMSVIPRVSRVPLKKGQQFKFIRYFVDDFQPTPYFEGLTGAGVKVAVLDTGCDPNHTALRNRIDFDNSRNYTDDYGGDPNDWHDDHRNPRYFYLIGHGTHCCGIVAAEPQNEVMYGVAPGATLLVKKVLNNFGGGQRAVRWCGQAIRDCIEEGADVISMSLGFSDFFTRPYPDDSDQLFRAVQEALAAGITVVVAAGNSGMYDTDNTIVAPGAYGGVITVASHDDAGNRSTFSSYGGELDLMGPGEVLSTKVGGGYHALQGTSMATPLVAGLAALFVEASRKDPSELPVQMAEDMRRTGLRARNPYEIRSMLRNLCERPNDHTRADGYGRIIRAYQHVTGEVPEDM